MKMQVSAVPTRLLVLVSAIDPDTHLPCLARQSFDFPRDVGVLNDPQDSSWTGPVVAFIDQSLRAMKLMPAWDYDQILRVSVGGAMAHPEGFGLGKKTGSHVGTEMPIEAVRCAYPGGEQFDVGVMVLL